MKKKKECMLEIGIYYLFLIGSIGSAWFTYIHNEISEKCPTSRSSAPC